MAYLYRNPYQQALINAQQEIEALRQQQQAVAQQHQAIVARIQQLEQTIPYLQAASAQPVAPISDPLPSVCLQVLGQSFNFMSVPEVRDRLKDIGVYINGKNPLGILHTTLGRLAQAQYVETGNPFPGAPIHYRITTAGRLALQR